MTDRDRLINLIINAKCEGPETGSFTEFLADYLIATGVILPPCKVGDKLYKIAPDFEKQRGSLKNQEYTVTDIIANALITRPYTVFKVDRIGADVFITREEAEKALERSKDNA